MDYEHNQPFNEISDDMASSKFFSVILFIAFFFLLFLYIRISSILPFYFIFGFILLIGVISTQKLYIEINQLQKWWFIFIGYTLVTSIFANNILGVSTEGSAKSSIVFFLIFIIVLYFVQFSDRICFFKIIRNFLAICSILGILEYITKFQFYRNLITVDNIERTYQIYGIPGTPNYRLILFFGHPIYFSIFLNIFLILLIYLPFNKKIINIFFGFIGLICLILTQSRSSWISLIIVLILYLFNSHKINKIKLSRIIQILFSILILITFIYILFYINPAFFQSISTILTDRINTILISPETASGARLANLSLINYVPSIIMIIFGGGNGYALSLLKMHPTVDGWTNAVDNQYLTFLLDYGIIGLLIFLYFVIICIKTFFMSKDKINKMIILLILSILITGYFFEFYKNMYVNYFLFILIAFVKENNKKIIL